MKARSVIRMRRLEIRRNKENDTLVLIQDGDLIGSWTVTPEVYHKFQNLGDLEDWEGNDYSGFTKPEDFGIEVIAYHEQSYWKSEKVDWIGYMIGGRRDA